MSGKSAKNPDPSRVTIVEGDVLDVETLKAAMQGQDVVYANLAGAMEQQAKIIVNGTLGNTHLRGSAISAEGAERMVLHGYVQIKT